MAAVDRGSMQRKILIMGLPGAGKTTLAGVLAPLLNAVVFNADAVRANLSRDLGFSHEDRVDSRGHRDRRFHLPYGGDTRGLRRRLHHLG